MSRHECRTQVEMRRPFSRSMVTWEDAQLWSLRRTQKWTKVDEERRRDLGTSGTAKEI